MPRNRYQESQDDLYENIKSYLRDIAERRALEEEETERQLEIERIGRRTQIIKEEHPFFAEPIPSAIVETGLRTLKKPIDLLETPGAALRGYLAPAIRGEGALESLEGAGREAYRMAVHGEERGLGELGQMAGLPEEGLGKTVGELGIAVGTDPLLFSLFGKAGGAAKRMIGKAVGAPPEPLVTHAELIEELGGAAVAELRTAGKIPSPETQVFEHPFRQIKQFQVDKPVKAKAPHKPSRWKGGKVLTAEDIPTPKKTPKGPAQISAEVFEKEEVATRRLIKSPKGALKLKKQLAEEEKLAEPKVKPTKKGPAEKSAEVFEKEKQRTERLRKSGKGAQELKRQLRTTETLETMARRVKARKAELGIKEKVQKGPLLRAEESARAIEKGLVGQERLIRSPQGRLKLREQLKAEEGGFIKAQVAQHLAGAGIGASVGYAADDENPIRGALIGAAIGTVSPTAIKGVIRALKSDPSAFKGGKLSNQSLRRIIDGALADNKSPDEILKMIEQGNKKYNIKMDLGAATKYMADQDLAKKIVPGMRGPIDTRVEEMIRAETPAKTRFTETGKEVPEYTGSTNLNMIEDEGALKVVKRITEERQEFTKQRRGKMTHKEIEDLARRHPYAEHKIMKIKPGSIKNAEDMTSIRILENQNAQESMSIIESLKKKYGTHVKGRLTDAERIKLQTQWARTAEIMQAKAGISTELGRAMGAQRIIIRSVSPKTLAVDEIMKMFGGREVTDEMVERVIRLPWDDMDQFIPAFNKFVMESMNAKTSDKIYEAWINALLSSPTTHAVNTTSNTLTFLTKYPEKIAGATIDLWRGGNRERFFGEVFNKHQLFGVGKGFTDGVRKGITAFISEMPSQQWGKLARVSKLETYHPAAIKGKKGGVIRTSGRLLMAADEFFKALNYHSELAGLAYRKATLGKFRGKARAEKIGEYLSNPQELQGMAEEEMLYRVFQKELGSFGKKLQNLRAWEPLEKYGYTVKPLGYIMPFLRTPTNIAKFAGERTPANLIRIAFLASRKKGGISGSQISDELAKSLLGSAMGVSFFLLAKEGYVTGRGPTNKAERASFYREGKIPYAIYDPVFTKKWVSFQRLEPLGSIIGMAADFADTFEERTDEQRMEIAGKIVSSIARNITSKTFMKGASDFMGAAMDPERFGDKWFRGIASTFVAPRLVSTIARAKDPYLRAPKKLGEALKHQIPGLREQKAARRDIWGEKIKTEGSFVGKLVSPIRLSTPKGSKIDKILSDLNKRGFARVSLPQKSFEKKGKSIKFTEQEYDRYVEESGKRAKKKLDKIVELKGFDALSDYKKERMIKKAVNNARSIIRARIIRDRGKRKRLAAVNE